MKSLVLVSHGNFAEGIKQSVEMIMGPQDDIYTVGLNPSEGQDDFRKKIEQTIEGLDEFIVFSDLMGGTPNNVVSRLLMEGQQFELYAGMNLPMIISFLNGQLIDQQVDLIDKARTNIVNVNEALSGLMNSGKE
ncbi:PTS sugar transporter subunit IIA [Aerococcus urinaeequi]|uniref:PTS sugar transporter subunit IIA n=1 Tax=Aerococcus urinaeequi TaxID=51665 RepID=UPI00074110B1|nr:PTS sugar transporter subunit IIA [Aerococcus urinaeequi]MCY7730576.1 PTS sugar transporter subunit IIA [Aerococcus urinaeequi]MDT2762088.1 PTS sugar transporter subunit IIA [Aerococcus urinaeequi]